MLPPAPGCAPCAARDEENAQLRDQLAWRDAEVTGLRGQVAAQDGELAELKDRIARLERAVSRNSGNSSMPPSVDDTPGRKPPRKKRRQAERDAAKKRGRGKQPGAPGTAMTWTVPMTPATITRRAPASAGPAWKTPPISGWPGPTSRKRSPSPRPRRFSMTCTRRGAPAG